MNKSKSENKLQLFLINIFKEKKKNASFTLNQLKIPDKWFIIGVSGVEDKLQDDVS